MTLVTAFLGFAAPSLADPGRPNLSEASTAVYPRAADDPTVLGDVSGEAPTAPAPTSALPFTGLSAVFMLIAGLIVAATGLSLRVAARSPRAAGSSSAI